MMKKILSYISFGLAAILIGFVALNAPYFFKQVKFLLGLNPVQQTQTSNSVSSTEEVGEPNLLQIPSLNITAPLQYVSENNEDVFQKALQSGVVHYPGTADVGQLGNAYFFGHSSDYIFTPGSYKTVFALLPSIQNGAEIIISGQDGHIYHYEVISQAVVTNSDLSVLDQKGNQEKLLSLQTSYPVGTALKRYVVVAKLKE